MGGFYGLSPKDVLLHKQIAKSKYGRGRKSDAYGTDWSKLGLPDNSSILDVDVASGNVASNTTAIANDPNHQGVTPGLEAADALNNKRLKSINP